MFEHSILGQLTRTDFSTPRLNVNKDGLTYTELGDRHYAVYDFVDGYCCADYFMPIKSRRPLIAQAGDTLARYHQLIEGFYPTEGSKFNGFMFEEHRLWRDVPWHLDVIEQYAKDTAKKRLLDDPDKFLLSIIDEVRDDLIEVGRYFELPDPQLPKRIIHGDYSPHNILFNQNKLVAVLDFGDSDLHLRALDLARGLSTFASAGTYGIDERLSRIFLQSYQARERLSKKEVAAIPDLLRWRYFKNIIWPLTDSNPYRGKPTTNTQAISVRNNWEGARWMKDHGDELRAALLSFI